MSFQSDGRFISLNPHRVVLKRSGEVETTINPMATILLIDDEDLMRRAMRQLLVSLGHEVFEAADGRAGLALFDSRRFELVITDIVMPGMEGLQVLLELRKRHRFVKVIAMSGGGKIRMGDYLHTAKLFGADALLAKPFSSEDLEAVLHAVLPQQPSLVENAPAGGAPCGVMSSRLLQGWAGTTVRGSR